MKKLILLVVILAAIPLLFGCQEEKFISWTSEDTSPPPLSAAQMGVSFYPNAKMEVQGTYKGSSTVSMTTPDPIYSVIKFYKSKLGEPLPDNSSISQVWTKLIPNGSIIVTVSPDRGEIGLVEIIIVRIDSQ